MLPEISGIDRIYVDKDEAVYASLLSNWRCFSQKLKRKN